MGKEAHLPRLSGEKTKQNHLDESLAGKTGGKNVGTHCQTSDRKHWQTNSWRGWGNLENARTKDNGSVHASATGDIILDRCDASTFQRAMALRGPSPSQPCGTG